MAAYHAARITNPGDPRDRIENRVGRDGAPPVTS